MGSVSLRSLALVAGLFVGGAVASFAVASAVTSSVVADQRETASTVVLDGAVLPTPIAATTGTEKPVFDYSMGGLAGDDTVKIVSSDASGVCFVVHQQHQETQGCADASLISTGLAYTALGEPDGSFLVVGVVPDSVDQVQVGGANVEIRSNIWTTRVKGDAAAPLVVADSRTGIRVSVGERP